MTNPTMGMAEAKALAKRLQRVVDASQEALTSALERVNTHGCQRAGPAYRRRVKAIRKHLQPVLAVDQPSPGGGHDFIYWEMSAYGRLRPVVMRLHPKKAAITGPVPVEISAHALERYLQYFRIRKLGTLDSALAALACGIVLNCSEGNSLLPRLCMHDGDNLVGHMEVVEDGDSLVACTWIGERSYTENKRRLVEYELRGALA